jgi:hypothetical protein
LTGVNFGEVTLMEALRAGRSLLYSLQHMLELLDDISQDRER